MITALYTGSFDPITNGHLDIAIRAAKLFDKLVIGVFDTPSKSLTFTTEERTAMVKEVTAGCPNIEVIAYSNLTVDFVKEIGAQTLVRGLRIGADFEREFQMALMNKHLAPDCELVCLIASPKYQYVSSSLLKEVAGLGGNIENLAPEPVIAALNKKMGIKV